MSRANILIVEDQSLISTNIRIMLKHLDYNVLDVVETGEKCLEYLTVSRPDIVLMDIFLPGKLDGIETTKIIKEKYDIPVVFLTSHTEKEIISRVKEIVPDGYLTKDISLKEQLPIVIEFVLYKYKMEDEHRLALQELKDSEEKFRSIVSSARDAIIFLDDDGNVSLWNQAAERIFGYTEEEVIGKKLYDLISPEMYYEVYKKGFSNFSDIGTSNFVGHNLEMDVMKKSKDLVPIELSLSSVQIKGKWCACGIARDITMKKTYEEEMERLIEEIQISRDIVEQHSNDLMQLNQLLGQSEEQLKQLNASKDKFFSIIAHDLKNPLLALVGNSEMLVDEINNFSPEEIKQVAVELQETSSHLYKLLENLLHWTRIQRGVLEYAPENFHLRNLANINIDLLKSNSKKKKIIITNNVDENLVVYADMNSISTIIRNLISNAIKFTPENGQITISAEKFKKDRVIISVKDTGIGIDESTAQKLFRIDSQLTTLGTNQEKGTGLGLILCKELIEKNKGEIWVESVVGEGTDFKFTVLQEMK